MQEDKDYLLIDEILCKGKMLSNIKPGKVPPIVSWLITDQCNMRCTHCYPDSSPEKIVSELDENHHIKIIDILANCGIKYVIISGGEPLLIPHLKKLIQNITAHNMTVSVCTNGSLVTQKIAKELKEAGLSRVSISIDGVDEGIHDELRAQRGAYRKAIEGIKHFSNAGVSVFVDYTATKINSIEISNLQRKVKEMGAVGLKIKRFVPLGRGKKNSESLTLSIKEMKKLLEDFFPYDISFCNLHDPAANSYYRVIHNYDNYNPRSISQRLGCVAALGWFSIQTSGDVTPCPLLNVPIGKILDDNLVRVFSDSSVVKSILDRDNREGTCGICNERYQCGGCRAHAYALSGNYLAEDPLCIISNKKKQD